jgi:hypothetical protein
MACVINSGVSLDCLDGVGGVDTIYITEYENLNTFTADTSGQVTTFTLTSGKKFWTFNVEKEDAQLAEAFTLGESGAPVYAQSLTFSVKKLSYEKRHLLRLVSQNRLLVIVKDANGNYLLMGKYKGAKLTATDANTGKALGDANGYNAITITSNEPVPMYFVQSSLITALTTPA